MGDVGVGPGSQCGPSSVCTGQAVCVGGLCTCTNDQIAVGPVCQDPPMVPPGSNCASGERCTGGAACLNSLCSCPEGTQVLDQLCQKIPTGEPTSPSALGLERKRLRFASPPGLLVQQRGDVRGRVQLRGRPLSLPRGPDRPGHPVRTATLAYHHNFVIPASTWNHSC